MTSEIAAYRHPVDSLREDHRRAISLIRLLTEQIDGLARLRPLDIDIAHSVFSYMTEFVDRHHHAREDAVIEVLGQKRPAAWRGIRQANQEHDQLAQHGQEILTTLKKLIKKPGVGGTELARRIRSYGETLRKHFDYEESRLFGLARTLLSNNDWRQIEFSVAGQPDPLFGPEVDAAYQALFQVYVRKVYEIGRPSRHTTVPAAAIVDAAAAAVYGSKALRTALRQGAAGIIQTTRTGAKTCVNSRSLSEILENAVKWSRSSFGETHAASGRLIDVLHDALREVASPLGAVLDTKFREFDNAHRRDSSRTSYRAQLVNLALRATVKRMAAHSAIDFEIPTKNIEITPQTIDRFIPALAKDIAVRRVELDSAFAEVIQVKDAPVTRTILYFPGGGFMLAPTQAHRLMAARLARSARAQVVMVHYRLAPEYRFPAGLDDCVEAYRHLLNEGIPAKSLVLAGDSAGGAMVLSSLLRIRDEGLPLPAAAVMLSPVTDLSYSGESRRHNSWTDPSLPSDDGNLIAQVYLGEVPNDHPLASPLFGDLSGLPPVLIQVGSPEMLLDDALRVAAKIRAQGGECECEVWHDMPHDWMLIGLLPEARKALRRIVEFMDDKFVDHLAEAPVQELERH